MLGHTFELKALNLSVSLNPLPLLIVVNLSSISSPNPLESSRYIKPPLIGGQSPIGTHAVSVLGGPARRKIWS